MILALIEQSHQSRWIRSVVLAALASVVVWLVITKSFAAYLARESPQEALSVQPLEPVALVTLANARLNEARAVGTSDAGNNPEDDSKSKIVKSKDRVGAWAVLAERAARKSKAPRKADKTQKGSATPDRASPPITEAERKEVRALAEKALLNDPLNARALRILGQLAVDAGDEARVTELMQAAADRSWSEPIAIYWLMLKAFEREDYATSLRYADGFLRKRPQFMAQALPVLASIAENKNEKAAGALKQLLDSNPPWRSSFFAKLPGAIRDARTPLGLLLSANKGASPPTRADLGGYLNFLIGRKFYELAYYTWLQFLPPEQLARAGFLINGSFEVLPSGAPFDWVIAQGSSGVTTDIRLRPELNGEQALYLEFGPGRADFRGVSQLLMLGPGTYVLQGQLKGEIIGRRGLHWSLTCTGAQGAPIGQSQMFLGTARKWTDFLITFAVPDTGCRAQNLSLSLAARSQSEQLVSGSIWYDEMQISRIERTDRPKQALTGKSHEQQDGPASQPTTENGSKKGAGSPGSKGNEGPVSEMPQ
jgi:hypothetical protein